MVNTNAFPFHDPLFDAAPGLKQALFPNLATFTHEEALRACFEALCFICKIQAKPMLDPLASTLEQVVAKMADSCGFITREINVTKVDFSGESYSLLIFAKETAMPGLIYYENSKPYLYNPVTGSNGLLEEGDLDTYEPMGFFLYKKWPEETKTIQQMAKMTVKETHHELKNFLLLQIGIGMLMLLQPYLTGVIFDSVIKLRQYSLIDQVFLGMMAAAFGAMAFKIVQNFSMIRFQAKSSAFLQSALWNRLLSFPLHFFKIFRLGDLHNRVIAVDHISKELTTSSMNALCQGFFSIIILMYITLFLPALGGIVFMVTLVFGSLSYFLIKRMVGYNRSITQTDARLMSFLFEAIRSVVKIKTSDSQQRIFHRWLNMELSKMSHFIRSQYLLVFYHMVEFILPLVVINSLYFLMVGFDPMGKTAPALSVGTFIGVQMALGQYFASLMGMVGVIDRLLHLVPHIERVRPILKIKSEQDGSRKIQTYLRGKITFQNVCFRYDSDGPLVLNNVNFTINPGEWVAIVGPSGSGKTTLMKLILGLESCESGVILLDDIPLEQLDLPTVRRQIGTVLQHTQLLPGSILDNLHASNPNMTEEEMMSLLKMVALHEDIINMPMGLFTVIMGDGRSFSMGQRQRLVLARCLAKPLSLLLLDEATSALDNFSQEIIMNTLRQAPITRVMVAHRPSTIRHASRIIKLDKGQVVGV